MTAPVVEQSVVLNGIRTRAISVDGDGPAILLLHGFTDSADSWRPLLAQLAARGRRAVAVDLPGYGVADGFPGGTRLGRLDGFTEAFVDAHAGDEPPVLGGNSLGGLLALRAATRPGVELTAVAPIGPAGLAYGPRLVRLEWLLRNLRPLTWALSLAPVPSVVVRRWAEWLYDHRLADGLADPSLGRDYASHFLGMQTVRRFVAEMLTLAADDRADPLIPGDVRVPVLLIWGRRDRLAAVEGAQALLDTVPASRLVVFEDCGHCPQVQRPAEIAELIAGLPASAAREAVAA